MRLKSTGRFPLALLAAVAAFGALPAAADFAGGMKAYLNGDYGIARREWLAAADAGDHDAEFWLGMADLNGWGGPVDPAKAARNFRFAAEAGHSDAQFNLAVLLRDVLGGSPAEIDDWLKKAAGGGSAEAQAALAERVSVPKVEPKPEPVVVAAAPPPVPKVEPKPEPVVVAAAPPPVPKVEAKPEPVVVAAPPPAPKIEAKPEPVVAAAPPPAPKIEPKPGAKVAAAPPPPASKVEPKPGAKVAAVPPPSAPKVEPKPEGEDVETLYKRGMAARSGLDETQDLARAADLLAKAAELGHVKAQYGLGAIHAVGGTGVLPDPIKAMMWMLISQRKGNRDAERGIAMLRQRLNPKQMEAASAQAEIWLSRHP